MTAEESKTEWEWHLAAARTLHQLHAWVAMSARGDDVEWAAGELAQLEEVIVWHEVTAWALERDYLASRGPSGPE